MRALVAALTASLLLAGCMETSPFQGPLLVVTTEIDEPVVLTLQGDWLYVASYDWDAKHAVMGRVDRAGGNFEVLASPPSATRPQAMAVDATHVYWTAVANNGGELGEIWRVAIDGGTPELLASDQLQPCGLAHDASTIFWRARVSTADQTVIVHARSKSSGTQVASSPITGIEVGSMSCQLLAMPDTAAETTLYLANGMGVSTLHRLAWNGALLAGADCTVARCGGNSSTVGDYQGEPGMIGIGDNIYWAAKASSICRAALASTCTAAPAQPPEAQQSPDRSRPAALASDGEQIYFVRGSEVGTNNDGDLGNGRVLRTDLDFNNTDTFSPWDASPRGLAVDDEFVYWGDNSRIFKTPK